MRFSAPPINVVGWIAAVFWGRRDGGELGRWIRWDGGELGQWIRRGIVPVDCAGGLCQWIALVDLSVKQILAESGERRTRCELAQSQRKVSAKSAQSQHKVSTKSVLRFSAPMRGHL